jgi:hypothetical protein
MPAIVRLCLGKRAESGYCFIYLFIYLFCFVCLFLNRFFTHLSLFLSLPYTIDICMLPIGYAFTTRIIVIAKKETRTEMRAIG